MNRRQLSEEFLRIGLRAGDNVILHSSFKSLGPIDEGPAAVIDGLLDTIGPAGNLLTPVFTYSLPMWNIEPFDPQTSKSRTGAITETLRLDPRAQRSFHPTHSVAVIGPDAEELTRNHMHSTPIGTDSPLDRMRRRNARILMLGTYQDTNSSLHLCEVLANTPYINVGFSEQEYEIAWFLNEERQVEFTQLYEIPGCSRGFRAVEQELRQRGVLKDVQVALAPSQLLELPLLVEAMNEILSENPLLLLCHTPACSICPRRRARMEKRLQAR